jgi:hypothetical protein
LIVFCWFITYLLFAASHLIIFWLCCLRWTWGIILEVLLLAFVAYTNDTSNYPSLTHLVMFLRRQLINPILITSSKPSRRLLQVSLVRRQEPRLDFCLFRSRGVLTLPICLPFIIDPQLTSMIISLSVVEVVVPVLL